MKRDGVARRSELPTQLIEAGEHGTLESQIEEVFPDDFVGMRREHPLAVGFIFREVRKFIGVDGVEYGLIPGFSGEARLDVPEHFGDSVGLEAHLMRDEGERSGGLDSQEQAQLSEVGFVMFIAVIEDRSAIDFESNGAEQDGVGINRVISAIGANAVEAEIEHLLEDPASSVIALDMETDIAEFDREDGVFIEEVTVAVSRELEQRFHGGSDDDDSTNRMPEVKTDGFNRQGDNRGILGDRLEVDFERRIRGFLSFPTGIEMDVLVVSQRAGAGKFRSPAIAGEVEAVDRVDDGSGTAGV